MVTVLDHILLHCVGQFLSRRLEQAHRASEIVEDLGIDLGDTLSGQGLVE